MSKRAKKAIKRDVLYWISEINNKASIHIGRGYLNENGKYKHTLIVPADPSNITDILYEQLLQFKSIYAIDSNTKTIGENKLVVGCAVHIELKYAEDNIWKSAIYTRLPAIISFAQDGNPETFAWKIFIESIAHRINGLMALVVDSELGSIPLFNAQDMPIYLEYFLPLNAKLIYASAERDLSSPLNKGISICDADATKICEIIGKNIDFDILKNNILSSRFGAIFLPPSS